MDNNEFIILKNLINDLKIQLKTIREREEGFMKNMKIIGTISAIAISLGIIITWKVASKGLD